MYGALFFLISLSCLMASIQAKESNWYHCLHTATSMTCRSHVKSKEWEPVHEGEFLLHDLWPDDLIHLNPGLDALHQDIPPGHVLFSGRAWTLDEIEDDLVHHGIYYRILSDILDEKLNVREVVLGLVPETEFSEYSSKMEESDLEHYQPSTSWNPIIIGSTLIIGIALWKLQRHGTPDKVVTIMPEEKPQKVKRKNLIRKRQPLPKIPREEVKEDILKESIPLKSHDPPKSHIAQSNLESNILVESPVQVEPIRVETPPIEVVSKPDSPETHLLSPPETPMTSPQTIIEPVDVTPLIAPPLQTSLDRSNSDPKSITRPTFSQRMRERSRSPAPTPVKIGKSSSSDGGFFMKHELNRHDSVGTLVNTPESSLRTDSTEGWSPFSSSLHLQITEPTSPISSHFLGRDLLSNLGRWESTSSPRKRLDSTWLQQEEDRLIQSIRKK